MELNVSMEPWQFKKNEKKGMKPWQRRMFGELFPSDVLFIIFSRLPIKSLLRFRCVSQLWRDIIDDPSLAYTHRLRFADQLPKVLLLDFTHEPHVTFREEGVFLRFVNSQEYDLEASCNGLLCFTKPLWDCANSPLFLFNPPRQQILEVVQPPFTAAYSPSHSKSYGLGFDCSTNTYKIVGVLSPRDPGSNLFAQVYTLGTGSWRAIEGPSCRLPRRPVYACGALHWLLKERRDNRIRTYVAKNIVYFDVGKEEFGLISLPESRRCDHLLDLGGHLAIVDKSDYRHIKIWVMKEYDQKKEWVKGYQFSLSQGNESVQVIGLCEGGEILVKHKDHMGINYYLYNPKTDVVKERHIPRLNHDTKVLCHTASLLSIATFRAAE